MVSKSYLNIRYMIVTEVKTIYGWVRNVLNATEYKTTKYDNGQTTTDVIVRSIAVNTYDRYGQIKPQPDSLIDIKV